MSASAHTLRTGPPPGPKGGLLLGDLGVFRREGPFTYWERLWREYGDLTSVRLGPMRTVLVVHPQDAEEVLVRQSDSIIKGVGYRDLISLLGRGLLTSEGQLWRRQRHALQPAFTPTAVQGFDSVLASASAQLAERWRTKARQGETVELTAEFTRFAMGTASRAIFDVDLHEERLDVARAFDDCFAFMAHKTSDPFSPPLFMPTHANLAFRRNRRLIEEFVQGLMQRSDVMRRPNWVFERLMTATGGHVPTTKEQVRDEIVTLFFAGYETSARALTWTTVLLLDHPDVMERLQREVDAALEGGLSPIDRLAALPLTTAIVEEALRLYPPAPMVARQNTEELELGGHRIPAKTLLVLSPYLTQRHPDFWPEPETFQPERFLDVGATKRPRCSYMPFGAGPRICIGQHLALRELVVALAEVVRSVDIARMGGDPVEREFIGTLKPARDVMIRLTPRPAA